MEPKSGHTWSRDGVGFLQGPRAIPWTQNPFGPNFALPLMASLAGRASEWAQWACCRMEYVLQAVKQSVISRGNHGARTSTVRELCTLAVDHVQRVQTAPLYMFLRGKSIQKYDYKLVVSLLFLFMSLFVCGSRVCIKISKFCLLHQKSPRSPSFQLQSWTQQFYFWSCSNKSPTEIDVAKRGSGEIGAPRR